MPNLVDVIVDHYPPVDATGVPLRAQIIVDFNREMNTDRLQEDFFVEGPDTDQFIGPGLAELQFPQNISQGEIDDFLMSPGYAGIVGGTFEFETVSGVSTRLIFTPSRPLAPLFDYKVHVTDTKDIDDNDISGIVFWGFQTGTGSIEELPSTISTSVLAAAPQAQSFASDLDPLEIIKTIPSDHEVEQSIDLSEIIIEFNKEVDPASVDPDTIVVQALPATDHPQADVSAAGDLAKVVEVNGRQLRIKI
jgi:hypothetical protein